MKQIVRYIALLALLGFAVLGGVAGGIVLDRQVLVAKASSNIVTGPDTQLIDQAWNIINKDYVDRKAVQPQELTYGAISGMVDALGDTGHTRFLSPDMVKEEQNQTSGHLDGVGIEVDLKDGHLVVVSPIDNTPAQKAGIKAGDIIMKVNGQDITDLPIDQIVQKIRGPAGTQVTLTIQNPQTKAIRDVTLTRARINIQNVTWQVIPGTQIADVRIAAFSQGVSKDLENTIKEIQAAGYTGIILDLRDDPGGLLDEAVGVTSQFLKKGNVLLEQDAKGKITPVPVDSKWTVTDLPVVVLINNGTASAAEITAAALRDAGRASLIGETTFGTGTVLENFTLSDGSALLLATQEWLTPNGQTIWHKGIAPNEVVQLPANATLITPDAMKSLTADQIQKGNDSQLLKALNMIQKPTTSGGNGNKN